MQRGLIVGKMRGRCECARREKKGTRQPHREGIEVRVRGGKLVPKSDRTGRRGAGNAFFMGKSARLKKLKSRDEEPH